MQVLLNEQGYVSSFAFVGELVGGIDFPQPEDLAHFVEHYSAYKLQDGIPTFDNEQEAALQLEETQADLRTRREAECFSVINRGQLWYEGISLTQLLELRQWYKAWLEVTTTLIVPEKPEWLT